MEENKNEACLDPRQISAYIDGELTDDETELVCAHLEECEDCRRYADEISRLSDIISEGEVELPSELHDRIMSGVRAEAMKERRKALVRKIGLYCGAGVAAMLCISLVTSPIFKGAMSKAGDAECEDNINCAPIEAQYAKSANGYAPFAKDDSALYFADSPDEENILLPEEITEITLQTETEETETAEETTFEQETDSCEELN